MTTSFFNGESTFPENNTTDQLIDALKAQLAQTSTDSQAAISAGIAAAASASNAAISEENVAGLSQQATDTLTAANTTLSAAQDATATATTASATATTKAAEAANSAVSAASSLTSVQNTVAPFLSPQAQYVFTATAGQTQWTPPAGVTFVPGIAQVFVNGVRWNRGESYDDSTGTQITFVNGLTLGFTVTVLLSLTALYPVTGVSSADTVGFLGANGVATTVSALASAATGKGADLVGFKQSGINTVARTLQKKGEESVSVADFGAVGDGSDETTKLVNAITFAATNKVPLNWPAGKTYGFTNIAVFVGGGMFQWVGQPIFKQLSTATPTNNAIEIGGASVGTVSLASTALAGATSFTLSDASSVQPGYLIRLVTNRLMYGDHRFDANNAFSQLVKVASVSGNVVTVNDPLVFDFPVAAVTTGTAQAGTSGTITLAAADATTSLALNSYLLTITSGTGAGQSRYVQSYNATTKVADIGTAYTGYPQAPWDVTPDATSVYSVSASASAVIYNPAQVRQFSITATGYSALNLVVQGVQVSFCDSPRITNCDISNFSNKALYTYRCYKPKVYGCHFSKANYGTSSGDGLGYGHVSIGDFGCQVVNCSADNCRTGFDGVGGTIYLQRTGNKVTGGGSTYDGGLFWPNNSNYINSGFSCHSGSYGVTDQSNEICDVYDNKQRGLSHTVQGNSLRGQIGFCFQISYSNGGTFIGNVYDDDVTARPSNGMNGNINGTEGPVMATINNRPQGFLQVRQNTMVTLASVAVKGNRAKSLKESLVYLTDLSTTSDLALDVIDNEASIIPSATLTASIVKPTGATALRDFTAYNNTLHVGGSVLGTAKADNMNKYPITDLLPTTTPFAMQTGVTQWLCILPNNTVTNIAVPLGQTVFKLAVYEKDYAVTNYFSGVVQRGNTTPILSSGNSGVGFSTASLTGTTGTVGNVTVSNRTDGTVYIENRSGAAGKFIVCIEGAS